MKASLKIQSENLHVLIFIIHHFKNKTYLCFTFCYDNHLIKTTRVLDFTLTKTGDKELKALIKVRLPNQDKSNS